MKQTNNQKKKNPPNRFTIKMYFPVEKSFFVYQTKTASVKHFSLNLNRTK